MICEQHPYMIALQRCKAGRFADRKIPMFCNVRVSFRSFRRLNVSVSMIVNERLINRLLMMCSIVTTIRYATSELNGQRREGVASWQLQVIARSSRRKQAGCLCYRSIGFQPVSGDLRSSADSPAAKECKC